MNTAWTWVVAVCLAVAGPCLACLRDAADERAVQWSTVVVEAKLTAIAEPLYLTTLRRAEAGKPPLNYAYSCQVYTFEVADVLDGRVRRGQDLRVIRFFARVDRPGLDAPPCSRHLRNEEVGKSFILLLRPERDLRLDVGLTEPGATDIRNDAVRQLNAFAIVNLTPREEIDADEKAELRTLIASTRAAGKSFSASAARRAAEEVARAEETPESEAPARTLLAMGPAAISEMQRVYSTRRGTRSGRERLDTLIAQLMVPPLPVMIEGPTAVERDPASR